MDAFAYITLTPEQYNALAYKANPSVEKEVDDKVAEKMRLIRLNMGKILEYHLKTVGKFNPAALYEELNKYLEDHV